MLVAASSARATFEKDFIVMIDREKVGFVGIKGELVGN